MILHGNSLERLKEFTDVTLLHGDCLELMKSIPDKSIDMVLADPPYGTTACKWDTVIPFEPMWKELKRVTKERSGILLFGQQPFTSALVMSNPKMFRYEWIWRKPLATGFLNSKLYPLKDHENVLVFCKKPHFYNPQFGLGKPYKMTQRSHSQNYNQYRLATSESDGKRFPKTVLEFSSEQKKIHPTQKPVALLEYLIKTYTSEGDVVLDFTMGSGSTGVAAKNLGRKFIGIEMDLAYVEIAKRRIG